MSSLAFEARLYSHALQQTGSGKTYTMNGIQQILCEDLFLLLSESLGEGGACSSEDTTVMLSFFELYGGFVQDLLNNRKRLKVLEDGQGEVVVTGLQEVEANEPDKFLSILEAGNQERTTHTTEANDTSSRSHAICQITLRDRQTDKLRGKFSLVDLAGSERGTDTKSHNQQRRAESADINTSLLSLKECIRALDMNKKGAKHVPYRGSKLTLILKDCFTSEKARTTMIATVSPGASAADHSLNTLRYADRIKEKRVHGQVAKKSPIRRRVHLARGHASKGSTKTSPPSQLKESSPPVDVPADAKTEPVPAKAITDKAVTVANKKLDEDRAAKEEELRRTVQAIFEQEEAVLNLHMSNIQENAELLTEEGKMLQAVQKDNVTKEEVAEYAATLEAILDRKEDMILALQDRLAVFQAQLVQEQKLSEDLGSLAQY